MTDYKLVPVEQIRHVIYALERFANDTLLGRNLAHELRELLSAAPAVQGGWGDWVLVPRTPTDAMLRAAQSAWLEDTLRRTTTMWRAMLAAAPHQPAAADEARGVVDEAVVRRVCDMCGCEVGASDELSDGSYRCDECFTFFAELNWYDPDDREERIEDYLKMKWEDM